jgi:hypothetical protein
VDRGYHHKFLAATPNTVSTPPSNSGGAGFYSWSESETMATIFRDIPQLLKAYMVNIYLKLGHDSFIRNP